MNDLNSLEEHKKLYKHWKDQFEEQVLELLAQGLQVIFVAMSRKMPRLIEMMNQLFSEGELKNFQFVSEHTLPYILGNFDSARQRIVIADDAMYYGSTINRISGYIRAITGQKPYVCPVVVSEVVGDLDHAVVYKTEDQIIHVESIPFLTTFNAEWIIRLCRPIDVEFPIIHFDIPSGQDKKNQDEKLFNLLREQFDDCDVYPIGHIVYDEKGEHIPVCSYNVLPRKETRYDRWNKDFCKIRFFVSDNNVQVISFAPGILPENVVDETYPLFTDARIQQLWEEVRGANVGVWPEELPDAIENDLLVDVIEDAYKKQCVRSKILWVNYLASFLYLLERKDAIVKTIFEVYGKEMANNPKITEDDTRLLLPDDLVEDITKKLTAYFKEGRKENSSFNGLHSAVLANQELAPNEYVYGYSKTLSRNLLRCRTADEALSVFFSSQHFFINNGRLSNDALQRTQRLGFGITYTALENKLAFPIGIKGLWQSIHRWIDKNIDEGTVKPKYERVKVDGKAYWLRMFRAGENEDSYTKMRRLCEYIIEQLRHKEIRGYVKRDTVDNLLSIVWDDPCSIMKYKYKWDEFEREKEDTTCKIHTSGRSFIDFLIDLYYLQDITDKEGVSRVSSIDNKKPVTPLSIEQEQAISDYVDVYYYFAETRHQPYVINNFFPKQWMQDYNKFKGALVDWCRQFAKYMQNYIKKVEQRKSLSEQFPDYNGTFDSIVLRSMMVTDFTVPDDKNTKWNPFANHFRKQNEGQFPLYREKLFSAAAILALFNQFFVVSENEKAPVAILEGYLRYIKKDDANTIKVIFGYIHMDAVDRAREENKQAVVDAMSHVLLNISDD